MTTAAQVLNIAQAELGYVERPTNRTKYGSWYGLDGNPWCAMFVSWCFSRAGGLELNHGKSAYTPSHADRFKLAGQWGTVPRPGAVVFFRFAGGPLRIHHVGLVLSVQDAVITTIEGNTSSGSSGSQANGGGVYKRRRTLGIAGFGYPAYAEAPSSVSGGLVHDRVLRRGSVGLDVQLLKQRLNAHSPADRQLDANNSIFGPATELRVRQFQEAKRLDVDGVVGAQTWAALG